MFTLKYYKMLVKHTIIPNTFILLTLILFTTTPLFCSWEQTTPVVGGYVLDIASNGEYLFLGTSNALYRSSDNGMHWELVNKSFFRQKITSICTNDSNIYVATPYDIYYSSDNGNNWTKVFDAKLPNYNRPVIFHNGYLFTPKFGDFQDVIYRSSNNGKDWQKTLTIIPPTPSRAYSFLSFKGNLFLGGIWEIGLFVSSDNGVSWKRVLDSINVYAMAANNNDIYIITGYKYSNSVRILKSSDNGNTWTEIKMLNYKNITSICSDSEKLYVGTWGRGVLCTSDNGDTWYNWSVGLKNLYITKLLKVGNYIYAVTIKDFHFSSDNGYSWVKSNEGMLPLSVNHLSTLNENIIATTKDGFSISFSSDNGTTWNDISRGIDDIDINYIAVVKNFILTGNGYRRNLTDSIWTKVSDNIFKVHIVLDTIIISYGSGIFSSKDFGMNWEFLTHIQLYIPYITHCENYYIFAGEDIPRELDEFPSFYRSTDTGKTFELIAGPSGDSHLPIYFTTGLTCLKNQLFRTEYSKIFRSSDFATSWEEVTNNLPFDTITAFAHFDSLLFIGTIKNGVWFTSNFGKTWTELNNGLENKNILSITSNNEYLFAGTEDGWVWRYPLKNIPLSVEQRDERITPTNQIGEIYFNPSNGNALLSFEIDEPTFLVVKIYDVLGNEISTLASEELPPGKYTKEWDSSSQSPGIYFIHLTKNDRAEVVKLVLIK
jgi:photosystem II stability/assembly factor-like uncharacterized protein